MQRTYSVTAGTTPDKAHAYVAEVTKHPEWSPDDMSVRAETPGAPAAGSRYHTTGKLQGRPNDSVVEVLSSEPGKAFTFKAKDKNSEWLHEFTFSAVDGGTRIDRRVTTVSGPPGMNIVLTLIHPFIVGPGNMRSMMMLKERLESGAS